MSAVAVPANAPGTEASAPQLRTLLLTDLCDSTQLVERLGDSAAADLFRRHDLLVLQLQQQWRGRLIDRSDGMLLLFERPIDGLGFALDYARGLRGLGREHRVELKARAGLHVGEVLTWRNSDEAVSVGAKPLEVEGLAKPMAARLMTVARPGQILVSAVAEPLAHRSARELGERGQQLLWKSYGRWRFKGLPNPQEIFEVGEAGIAPLRVPKASPKAWRDIPLWRRPAALAAEIALVVGIGLGIWFVTKPQPALAFNERDWVVVADLRNLTGQSVLDDSLEQAFRISLEQSRYVNVLSDLKARQTLERMRLPAGTELDRTVAAEIAIRDGARAVILPTVAEIGGHVRVSAEVIDPQSQTTVYTEFADGRGVESALSSIDDVTRALRAELGEALEVIEATSTPLPQVSTANLDALRAYALAQEFYAKTDFQQALALYKRATEFDPQFALAWIGQVRALFSMEQRNGAAEAMRHAQAAAHRLAPREAMYLEAWSAELTSPDAGLKHWKELTLVYPDYMPGYANAAMTLHFQNRLGEAENFARNAIRPEFDLVNRAYDTLGRVLLGKGEYAAAQQAFEKAAELGFRTVQRRQLAVAAASKDHQAVEELLKTVPKNNPFSYFERISVAVDRGDWDKAYSHAATAQELLGKEQDFVRRALEVAKSAALWRAGRSAEARARIRDVVSGSAEALAADENKFADAGLALSAALLGQRLGDKEVASEAMEMLSNKENIVDTPVIKELSTLLAAQRARIQGSPEEAISMLTPLLTGNERYQTRVELMLAYKEAENISKVRENAQWLSSHRGLAFGELGFGQSLQALNVIDSNLAAMELTGESAGDSPH